MLTPKNMHALRTLFNLAHKLHPVLGSSWILVLENLNSLDRILNSPRTTTQVRFPAVQPHSVGARYMGMTEPPALCHKERSSYMLVLCGGIELNADVHHVSDGVYLNAGRCICQLHGRHAKRSGNFVSRSESAVPEHRANGN